MRISIAKVHLQCVTSVPPLIRVALSKGGISNRKEIDVSIGNGGFLDVNDIDGFNFS